MSIHENSNTKRPLLPVSIKMMTTMIKVSQALAKLKALPEVTAEEVEEVRMIFDEILFKNLEVKGFNKKMKKQIDRSDVSHLSLQKQTRVFLEVLCEDGKASGNFNFAFTDLNMVAKQMKMSVGMDFFDYLERLCNQGHMIQKANRVYELLTKINL